MLVDPMSIEESVELEWFEIRDAFLGSNFHIQAPMNAFYRAATCSHPDAQWLHTVLEPKFRFHEVVVGSQACVQWGESAENIRAFFYTMHNDARALYFSGYMNYDEARMGPMVRSADMGYPAAMGWFARHMYCNIELFGADRIKKELQSAADVNDPVGLYYLGRFYSIYESKLELADFYYRCAARRGNNEAREHLAQTYLITDPMRYHWYHKALVGSRYCFVPFMRDAFSLIQDSTRRNRLVFLPALYMVGSILSKDGVVMRLPPRRFGQASLNPLNPVLEIAYAHVRLVFGHHIYEFESDKSDDIQTTQDYYRMWTTRIYAGIKTWLLVARRVGNLVLNVNMRKKIARLVWDDRLNWLPAGQTRYLPPKRVSTKKKKQKTLP
jgi:hypothetical protein